MSIVDDLLAIAGCYTGSGRYAPGDRPPWVARIVVTPLPGKSGVALDYEALAPDGRVLHREHSLLARSASESAILVVAYEGQSTAMVLQEIEPGFFAEPQTEPYPEGQLGIRVDVPSAGAIRYAYSWVGADGRFEEVDVAEVYLSRGEGHGAT